MKPLLSLILIFAFYGCDAPRTKRNVAGGSSSTNGLDIFGNPMPTTSRPTPTTGSGTPTGPAGGTTIPAAVEHCSWSSDGSTGFQSSAIHLSPNEDSAAEGAYTLCQSSSNELEVYLQVKNPINDTQLCLIPTYNSGSNSVYIGEPRCLYVRNNTSLYKINLIKNRPGYTGYSVSGVMMMKDKAYEYGAPFYQYILSPDAYIFCSQWLALYGDPSYCVPFKSAGNYVYHEF